MTADLLDSCHATADASPGYFVGRGEDESPWSHDRHLHYLRTRSGRRRARREEKRAWSCYWSVVRREILQLSFQSGNGVCHSQQPGCWDSWASGAGEGRRLVMAYVLSFTSGKNEDAEGERTEGSAGIRGGSEWRSLVRTLRAVLLQRGKIYILMSKVP